MSFETRLERELARAAGLQGAAVEGACPADHEQANLQRAMTEAVEAHRFPLRPPAAIAGHGGLDAGAPRAFQPGAAKSPRRRLHPTWRFQMRKDPMTRMLSRIRGEFLEMPGLGLTIAQAARLWHLDASVCRAILRQLVADRFLTRTSQGAYLRLDQA